MSQCYLTFDIPIERVYRLRDVEDELKRVMVSPPTRATLVNWCEDGTLEAKQMRFGWIVYETSVRKLVRSLQREPQAA
jgi:hypothetical protein